jgi:hypothetical protein
MFEVTQVTETPRETGRERDEPTPEDLASIESYETEDGVVFYDADNPLAWMEADRTVQLEEAA